MNGLSDDDTDAKKAQELLNDLGTISFSTEDIDEPMYLCHSCNGTRVCTTIDNEEEACLTCNGSGYLPYDINNIEDYLNGCNGENDSQA